MNATKQFDYIIIGSGLAGLQLALAFSKDEYFKHKKIALLDKSSKTENDKTWCFWEQGEGNWETIIHKSWSAGEVITSRKQIDFQLEPYQYKMIRSIDFYKFALAELKNTNIEFIHQEVISTEEEENSAYIITSTQTYQAAQVFDSRIPQEYFNNQKGYINIYQHFKGWMIETEEDIFNPEKFTMMDYRLKWKESTSFTYVLPISTKKAFVEYTFFTPFKTDEKVYDKQLKKYIEEYLHLKEYQIIETEMGIIPMTNFPFHKYHSKNFTKIGTAGGWVKASTGYSFKHTEKKIKKLIQNLKSNRPPHQNLLSAKFQYYDKVFLKVLEQENKKGEWIFENFYAKNSIQEVFQYLDEETSLPQDLKIMGSLLSPAFVKAFFKTL